MLDDDTTAPDPEVWATDGVPLPSGSGMTMNNRPSSARQLTFSALGGVAVSVQATFQAWIQHLATTPTGLVLVFFITMAALIAIWLAFVGFRTLDRRRLLRRFPGTLVFSFHQTSEVVNALRQLNAFEPGRRDFDFGSVQTVADLRGLSFWQRNPPERYASLPWAAVESLTMGSQARAQRSRPEATVDIEVRSVGQRLQISLFGVDASILPLPTRREVSWVHRELENLLSRSTR